MLSVFFYLLITISQLKILHLDFIQSFILKLANDANYIYTKHTFKELDILSNDILLKGINPNFVFYIPTKSNLVVATVTMKIKTSPNLREDSFIEISLDDIPVKHIKAKNFNGNIKFQIHPSFPKEFTKVTINSYLRVSNNICEDLFANKSYIILYRDSIIEFKSLLTEDIYSFLDDYYNKFSINDFKLLPLVYYLSARNSIYPCFYWHRFEDKGVENKDPLTKLEIDKKVSKQDFNFESLDIILEKSFINNEIVKHNNYFEKYSYNNNYFINQNFNFYKKIVYSDKLFLENEMLYVNDHFIKAIENSYKPLLFGRSIDIQEVRNKINSEEKHEISLRDLGYKSTTVYGHMHTEIAIPVKFSDFGGIPDNIYFNLKVSHSNVFHKEFAEIRVLVNDVMIKAFQVDGGGEKSYDVKLPIREFNVGNNFLKIQFVKQINPEFCKGALQSIVFTLFDSSYFYWNSSRNFVSTISEFFQMMNGKVAIFIEDKNLLPISVKLFNRLGRINKNVTKIEIYDLLSEEYKGKTISEINKSGQFNYILFLTKSLNQNITGKNVISNNEQNNYFNILNPLNGEVIFRAIYQKPFVVFLLDTKDGLPKLTISEIGKVDASRLADIYSLDDILKTAGNVLILSEKYFASFEVGKKFSLVFEDEKNILYYWNKYKLFIITFIGLLGLAFFSYIYKRLSSLPAELRSSSE